MILPIEILPIEQDLFTPISDAVKILNSNQTAFRYQCISNQSFSKEIPSLDILHTKSVFQELNNLRTQIKGYHPHILCLTSRYLENDDLGNLFGDLERSNSLPTGNGVFTIYQLPDLIKEIPIRNYVIYELLLFAMLFLIRENPFHEEKRGCVFDLKIEKEIMYNTLKHTRLCLECNKIIRRYVNQEQLDSIRNLMNLISDISHSPFPDEKLESLIVSTTNERDTSEGESEFSKIREKLIGNDLRGAIENLSRLLGNSNPEKNKELILMYSRLSEIELQERLNLLERSLIEIEKNRIRLGIINILTELEN